MPSAFALISRAAGALCLLGAVLTARAAETQEVEVTSVRFLNVRAPNFPGVGAGAPGNWFEADVALNVRPAPGARGQMVSRVRVALLVGFELPGVAGGERRLEHYRAEAECAALEAGRVDIRFYLPPEIVKRDRLHGDPEFWGIEIMAGGKPLVAGRAAYSTSLAGAEQRRNFQTRAGQAAAANDGVMLPQYLTPFAHEYPRATPSFVRREAR